MTLKITRASWDTSGAERALKASEKKALLSAGEHTLKLAESSAPRDKGKLVESGRVALADDDTVEIGYTAKYAVIQHEDTTLRHTGSGRAKWLQLTLQEQARSIFATLAGKIKL